MIMTQEDPGAKSVHCEYYNARAAEIEPRPFPSPVNYSKWLNSAVDWFSRAETIMEVGPGRGEFAEALIRRGGPKRYYLVDMSKGMLDLVKEKMGKLNQNTEVVFIHVDIDSDPLNQVPDNSLDKIIMINTFQDINPYSALKTLHRIISPEGIFRVNVISRESWDEKLHDEEQFDKGTGAVYNKGTGNAYFIRSPSTDVKPLGYFADKKGDLIPYYRILKSYYCKDLDNIFKECKFKILSADSIIQPNEVLLRAKSMSWNRSAFWPEILSKFGGFPANIDITARPI